MERAIFVGGCLWCMIQPFDTLPDIHTVMSGYTGEHVPDPAYKQVKSQTAGHTGAVEIIYDPALISYEQLVELYWQQTDPIGASGQFEDRGDNYHPVIFYLAEEQRTIAEDSKKQLAENGRFEQPVTMEIEPAQPSYPVEEDYQEYYKKHPENFRRNHAHRATFIEENWRNKE